MSSSVTLPPPLFRRRWLFRLGAVLLGLTPLLVIEVTLVLLGRGQVDQQTDPFVGFDGTRPLFVLNSARDRYQIAPARYLCFRPDSFRAHKADNEFRVFCLGGSTVQGNPYAIETAFTTWLELSLQAANPGRVFDVVNCGGISYASYRLVPILAEVLGYQPDLIILYTGHNEFLEDRSYRQIKARSPATRLALQQATRLRSFNLLWSACNNWRSSAAPPVDKTLLPAEVNARLDYPDGLAAYQRDPQWRAGIIEHFAYNIRRMIAMCQSARVPIWIVDPVSNLRSSPPFKSQHRDGLTEEQQARWQQLRHEASELYRTNLMSAVGLLEQAAQIDDQHAGLQYDLAKCYDALGQMAQASAAYVRAKELDVCPLRAIEPFRQAIGAACRDTQTVLIDVHGLYQRNCRDGIPGGYLLVDHVHPSITGHQLIAELMYQECVARGIVTRDAGWTQRRDQLYAAHAATLGDTYYLEAQRRLEGLRRWAAGRATRLTQGLPPT